MIKEFLASLSNAFRDASVGLLLVLIIFLAYGNSLNHSFVWDDEDLIVKAEHTQSPRDWSGVLTRSFWDIGSDESDDARRFYRPVVSFSYLVDFELWGLNPRGYHLTNLILHATCAYLVYVLGIMLLGGRLPGVLAAALFAVHPSHVENVSWISGRTDVLCGLFFVLSFIFFLRYSSNLRTKPVDLVLMLLCFLLSMLAKETGITLLGIVLLHYLFAGRDRLQFRGFMFLVGSMAAVSAAYILLRFAALGDMSGQLVLRHWFIRIASIPMVFAKYLGILLHLVPTDPHHSESLITDVWSIRYAFFFCVSAIYVFCMWLAWRSPEKRELGLLLGWTPAVLVPVFNFGTFGDITYADRFLYVPSIGFFYLVVICVLQACHSCRSKRVMIGVIAFFMCLTSLSAVRSRQTSSYWSDNESLFERAVTTSPDSVHIRFNLANSYVKSEDYSKACQEYARVILLEPDYEEAYINMAFASKMMKNYPEAIALFRAALALNSRPRPSFEDSIEKYRRRGLLLVAPKQELSEDSYRRKARRYARSIYSQLGDIYRDTGDAAAAIASYTTSLSFGESYEPHHNLGAIFLNMGRFDAAQEHLERALAMDYAPATLANLGILASMRNDHQNAVTYLIKAVEAGTSNAPPSNIVFIHYYLARSYFMIGDTSARRQHARVALNYAAKGYSSSDAVNTDLRRFSTVQSDLPPAGLGSAVEEQ